MEILSFLRESAADHPCPSCHLSLAGCGMELTHQEDGVYGVEVTCARCDTTFLVLLQVEPDDRPVPEAAAPPIGADEVLDVHLVLRDHNGPLTELLAQA
ncbi:MAG: hypothetical protein ABR541_01900 [Candidatus Dormibacteria bacterium]